MGSRLSSMVTLMLVHYDSRMARKKGRLVYSTDDRDMERIREQARKAKRPAPVRSLPPQQQTIRIKREKKGRGGKTVTVLYDWVLSAEDAKALAKIAQEKMWYRRGGQREHD